MKQAKQIAGSARSIQRKLFLTLAGTGLGSMLLLGIALQLHESLTFKRRVLTNLEALTDMIAVSVQAAVDFEDPATARETLAVLASHRDLTAAVLYTPDGREFAAYRNSGQPTSLAPQNTPGNRTIFTKQSVRLDRELKHDGRVFGRLTLESGFASQEKQFHDSINILLLLGAAVSALLLLLAKYLQRLFTAPLLQLTTVAKQVHASGNFQCRAPVVSQDEVGELAVAFNEMLEGIADRDRQIASSHAFQQAILTDAGLAIISCDIHGLIQQFNPAASRMLGYSESEMVGLQTPEVYHDPGEIRTRAAELSRELGRTVSADFQVFTAKVGTRQPEGREWTLRRKDGHHFPAFLTVSILLGGDGQPIGYCGVIADLTARRAAEQSLRESEERFRQLVENANDLIVLTNLEGEIVYASPNHTTITGWQPEEMVGRDVLSFIHSEDLSRLASNFLQSTNLVTYRCRFKDGKWHWLESSGRHFATPAGAYRIVMTSRDITRRVEADAKHQLLETQLRQAQKMEAIGTLAGGIAHDFNNILTGILGNITLARMDLPENHPALSALEDANKASHRARELVAQILTFSRHQEKLKIPTHPAPLVKEAMRLLRSSLPTTIEITLDIDPDCPPVICDPTQLHQVIMNLGTNAAHAMRERGRRLTVGLHRVQLTPAELARHNQLRSEHTLCLSISDEGSGIPSEIMDRIFEPFFTTKSVGEGTGLGLSVVLGIVQDHGGAIVVDSSAGRGTTFRIYFPTTKSSVNNGEGTEIKKPEAGRAECIMVVDDDALVANAVSKMLYRLGYRPETHLDPRKALEAFQARPTSYHALLTDLTMPGITGTELAREIFKLRANLPVILATGFMRSTATDDARLMGIRHFVQKPYSMDEVGRTLQNALQN